jgi:hypothetical protein
MLARMRETEMKWSERVRQWRASGGTAEQFAQGQGFEASTLRYWASRLKTMGAMAASVATPAESAPKPSIQLVRVRRARAGMPVTGRSSALTIGVGAARIEVGPGFDRALLREVVDVLGGRQ